MWFRGIAAIHRHIGVKTAYDLSATPFYLRGSGYNEGFIFPWTVSDFSLMEAIESGIVKIPRIPVDDDAAGDQVTYLHLWQHVGKELPKRLSKDADTSGWKIPEPLEGALRSLHRSYARSFEHWQNELEALGEPPPVMIVVCPNTAVSRLVHDWIAGHGDAPGQLVLFSNMVDGVRLASPRTVLIDSVALESGETLDKDFKAVMAGAIDTFKAEIRRRSPGTDVEALTDEDLLREVMNTIGKPGRLGEHVRCVVSVSMLTEGWDANTVTHILGIRAFGSQLLCEQVVGRGLRRRGFALDENGRFSPEYAQIYGVPFAFIPGDGRGQPGDPKPAQPAVHVHAVPERAGLEITFPVLDGYRMEVPDELFFEAFDDPDDKLHVQRDALATWVQAAGVVGVDEDVELTELRNLRPATLAYKIAAQLLDRFERDLDDEGAQRPWLFPELLAITKRWLDECVTLDPDAFIGLLDTVQGRTLATERVYRAIVRQEGNRAGTLGPMIRTHEPQRSTADVNFVTRKKVIAATKSHVNVVTLDSGGGAGGGNSWEEAVAGLCESDDRVAAYVKNDGLHLRIPYVHKGRSRSYVPDFLVRLAPGHAHDDGVIRTLIVEVSGTQKSPGPTKAKAATARDQWCVAVNNHGGWGRWGYVELTNPGTFGADLGGAIEELAAQPAEQMRQVS